MHFSNQQRDFSSIGLSERGIVAYFSMEIAIAPEMPTYSGGLGVLAGDTMRSAADLGLGLCAVTLLHRKGYFQQHLDAREFRALRTSPGRWKIFWCSKTPWSR
jgi:glucan phosphorylase